MDRIVVLDGYTTNPGDLSWASLTALGLVDIYDRTPTELVIDRAFQANIIVTNKVSISKSIIEQLPHLRLIVVMATGYNIVDIDAAKSKGIPVCNVRDYSSKSVAQQVFSYILHFQNKVAAFDSHVKQGDWAKSKDFTFFLGETHEIFQKTIGIVGFGKIGREVAQIANAFGMKILVASRNPQRDAAPHIEIVDFEKLLSRSDFVSLHTPLNKETFHLINAHSLKHMKPNAILINTGRGQLVDENALAFALKNKIIRGAALDVLSEEPPQPHHILIPFKQCIITPHTAWSSQEARKRLLNGVVENIRSFQNGKTINQVN